MSKTSDWARKTRVTLCAVGAAAGVALQGCASSSIVAVDNSESVGAPVAFKSGERYFRPQEDQNLGYPATDNSYKANLEYSDQPHVRQSEGTATQTDQEFLFVSSNLGMHESERGSSIIVQKGDTMYGISQRFRVPLQALIAANNASPPYIIKIGQTVWLPPPNIHIVEQGEDLRSVSERFNVDYRSLAVLNQLHKPYHISPGDQITLLTLARDFGEFHIASNGVDDSDLVSKGAPNTESSEEERVFSDQAYTPPPVDFAPDETAPVGLEQSFAAKSGPVSSQGFAWPLDGAILQGYGEQPGGVKNEGLNIAAANGAPVYAAAEGRVVYAGADLSDFGNLVLISHEDDWVTAYAHTSRILVNLGEAVKIGQPIAAVGETGAVGDPQLHFQIRKKKTPVDPSTLLPKPAAS